MQKKVHIIVIGHVQGVFYRQSTAIKARQLGISGWVRNLTDGSVEIEMIGDKEQMEEMISWLRQGPPAAKVESLDIQWQDCKPGSKPSFEVLS